MTNTYRVVFEDDIENAMAKQDKRKEMGPNTTNTRF